MPFLADPHRNHTFTDPIKWADSLKGLLEFRELEAKAERTKPYKTINSLVQTGELKIVSIDAPTPFTVTKYEHDFASVYMPYRSFTEWQDESGRMSIESGEGILYFAPGTDVRVDTDDSSGIVTLISRTALIEKTVTLSRGSLSINAISSRVGRSRKFVSDTKIAKYLVSGIYNCYLALDAIYRAGEETLRQVVMDDAFMRILILLLFPELRSGGARDQWQGNRDTLMKDLEEWIVENLSGRLTMTDLEAKCNYTARSIQNYFHARHNMSPKQWIIKQRMRRAFQLLTENRELSVSEVAISCGYYDHSRFSRHFEKEYGVFPRDCKKARLI